MKRAAVHTTRRNLLQSMLAAPAGALVRAGPRARGGPGRALEQDHAGRDRRRRAGPVATCGTS